MKTLLFTILFLLNALSVFPQAINKISGRCTSPYQLQYTSIEVQANGDIKTQPCGNRGIYTNGVLNPSYLQTLTEFNTVADFTTNFLNVTTSTSSQFRLGNKNTFFEQLQNNAPVYNDFRIRTNETTPPFGGFAEFWAISDATHSYAYVRAQRSIFLRSDDLFVSNFFDNNKFKMRLQMDAIATHPLEDTSKFSVGNYTDRTNFIEIENVTNNMILQAQKIAINPTGIVPATATTPCSIGQIEIDASFFYYCYSVNNWVRTALSTW